MKPLSQFTQQQLEARLQGLAKNLFLAHDPVSGKAKLYLPSEVREQFNETYDEVDRRGAIPRLEVEDMICASDPMPILHPNSLVRYGKRKYLEQFIAGIVSFGPAESYKSQSNAAQRDDETLRSWHAPDRILKIGGKSYSAIELTFGRKFQEEENQIGHYHSFSFSLEESPKLQRAFDAEGYILINDRDLCLETIAKAVEAEIGSGRCDWRQTAYYDDRCEPELNTLRDFVFSKTISFQYQREMRIAAFGAPEPTKRFEIKVSWPRGLVSDVKHF